MNIETYFKSLETKYNLIYTEIETELQELQLQKKKTTSFFDYTKHLTDPFQAITTNPDEDNSILNNLYDWYQTINPKYISLTELNPNITKFNNIQPYRTLLLNMAKDLIILKHTKQFPKPNIPQITNNNKDKKNNYTLKKYNKNNKTDMSKKILYPKNNNMAEHYKNRTNISRILYTRTYNENLIDSIIDSILQNLNNNLLSYNYLSIIDIIDKYLKLFSFGEKNYEEDDKFSKELSMHNDLPFLIYPTFNPISYTKVIYFMQAPVLNFMMMNTRKLVHSSYEFPYHQIYHDLLNHANKTHQINKVRENLKIIEDIFEINNKMINILKNHINYDIKQLSDNHSNNNINKFILCYALFIICHELGVAIFNSIDIDTSIDNTIKNIKDSKYIIYILMESDLNQSLLPSKYNISTIIKMIKDETLLKNVILQLENLKPQHKGGKRTNKHYKQTKKKSNRKKTNKLTITNLLKKTHIK